MTTASQEPAADRFLRPLDFIESEHERQRVLCDRLVQLANDLSLMAVTQEAESVLAFITEDLPLHHEDEEKDLFRLLRHRCRPEDGIDAILAHLAWEHTLDSLHTHYLRDDLEALASGKAPDTPMRIYIDLRAFAESQLRHLAWEEKVVVPLARKRLVAEDLAEMAHNMALRRGNNPL
jgi:hemerythrin-like domain-containing protein